MNILNDLPTKHVLCIGQYEIKMENQFTTPEHSQDKPEEKLPDVAVEEKDDAPAGRNIKRTLIIAVCVLIVFYLIYYFMSDH